MQIGCQQHIALSQSHFGSAEPCIVLPVHEWIAFHLREQVKQLHGGGRGEAAAFCCSIHSIQYGATSFLDLPRVFSLICWASSKLDGWRRQTPGIGHEGKCQRGHVMGQLGQHHSLLQFSPSSSFHL